MEYEQQVQFLDQLREAIPTPYQWEHDLEAVIVRTHEASKLARQTMKDAVADAIANGELTRVEAAKIVHVHPLTISRWLLARETKQE